MSFLVLKWFFLRKSHIWAPLSWPPGRQQHPKIHAQNVPKNVHIFDLIFEVLWEVIFMPFSGPQILHFPAPEKGDFPIFGKKRGPGPPPREGSPFSQFHDSARCRRPPPPPPAAVAARRRRPPPPPAAAALYIQTPDRPPHGGCYVSSSSN